MNNKQIGRIKKTLISDEGLRLKPYKCSSGKTTIGIGRNLEDKGISDREAEFLLDNDIEDIRVDLIREMPWIFDLDEVRQNVFVNMAFNLGITGLLGFKNFLKAAKNRNFEEAAEEMLNSKWASQVGKRAERLAMEMRGGQWT